jgi:hypothetical protein
MICMQLCSRTRKHDAADVNVARVCSSSTVSCDISPLPWLSAGLPDIFCPKCGQAVERPVLVRLFPETLQQLEETLTNAWLQAHGVIRCVGQAQHKFNFKVPGAVQMDMCVVAPVVRRADAAMLLCLPSMLAHGVRHDASCSTTCRAALSVQQCCALLP